MINDFDMNMSTYSDLADSYDEFMENVDYGDWADFLDEVLERRLELNPRYGLNNILELGCGSGAITEELLMRGYKVTAVDSSPDMLAAADFKLSMSFDDYDLRLQDIRRLKVGSNKYDGAVCCCDVLNYIMKETEIKEIFKRVYGALKKDTFFIFDLSSEFKFKEMTDGMTFGDQSMDACFICTCTYYPEERINEMELSLFELEEDGRYSRTGETHRHRAYDEKTLTDLLIKAGFESVETAHDFENRDEHEAMRLIFIAKK